MAGKKDKELSTFLKGFASDESPKGAVLNYLQQLGLENLTLLGNAVRADNAPVVEVKYELDGVSKTATGAIRTVTPSTLYLKGKLPTGVPLPTDSNNVIITSILGPNNKQIYPLTGTGQ